jgi:hypothetical protein
LWGCRYLSRAKSLGLTKTLVIVANFDSENRMATQEGK